MKDIFKLANSKGGLWFESIHIWQSKLTNSEGCNIYYWLCNLERKKIHFELLV